MTIPNLSQKGRVALVTGARRGLGKAIALAFAEAGADVAICDHVTEGGELEGVGIAVGKLGRRALPCRTDVTREIEVDRLVADVMGEFGRIDVLVNNAALLGGLGPLLEHSQVSFAAVMDTNIKGPFICTRAVSKVMIQQKSGIIINMASVAAFRAGGVYSVSKAALAMLTRVCAKELAPFGIRVNAIAPYVTRTEKEPNRTMSEEFWSDPQAISDAKTPVPLGRLGDLDDITGASLFLASEAAGHITGHVLVVDGGFLA
jgi:NAD(P)-dependent dehydrogenase (short-subunit alcohol dehydrogenase family)